MRISILTIFPNIFDSFLRESMLARAIALGLLSVQTVDIRTFSDRKHKNTDDDPFGGGAGMVMLAQPIVSAMASVATSGVRRIFLSPRGATLTQQKVKELASIPHIALLCGHYEGVDQRAIDLSIDEEISIGDYILTGGEPAAMVLVDAVARLIPGVLGCAESAEDESFTSGLLEYPHYTRPRAFMGHTVPDVLLGGNHAEIIKWRRSQALRITRERRPDLLGEKDTRVTKSKLHLLWTNTDIETSLHMVMMYATNSLVHRFWEEVTVILWGATPNLVVSHNEIQDAMRVAMNVGVAFSACISCAERYGIVDELRAFGVQVVPWGEPLSELLRSGSPLLSI
ncbi:MAG: tRNA (guanosine(37)-N1)-methyltransferase TrmD [Clostridia bacterium]|nr:tRNA (guanosine(37)-N1)-methyltransferase TrmD [Clostridia bacterium]